jgi:heat shock protein HslJ
MFMRTLLLPPLLAACATAPVPLPPVKSEVRPVVAHDNIQGRWTIAAVNGKPTEGLWIELGGEGLGTVTTTGGEVFVASPQPRTKSHLGCNEWYPNGWMRNGDKLIVGREMSIRTERGCDPETMAIDDAAYAILTMTMTMEYQPPDRLRLINEKGTLELVREKR